MTLQITAGFETLGDFPHSHRYCVWSEPTSTPPVARIVYVPPFGEEMNKSRRMAALQSRAFAASDCSVLQIDLLGCGDSAGDTGDADWARWVADVIAACRLANTRFERRWPGREAPPLWLWALRSGCLLAVEAARQLDEPCGFVFWQPALSGRTVLQQFFRLDSVGAAIGKPGHAAREPARAALAAGRTAFVAGYAIAPALANGLDRARLEPPPRPGPVHWFDISPQPGTEPFAVVQQAQSDWQRAGFALGVHRLTGPMFWLTTEIVDVPALIEATLRAVRPPDAPERAVSTNITA